MRNLKLIIRREYLSRVRNKTFMVMTFLSPMILVGMIMLIAYLTMLNNEGVKRIAIHDKNNNFQEVFQDTEGLKFDDLSGISMKDARKIVEKDEYYGLLFIPDGIEKTHDAKAIKFFSKDAPGYDVADRLERKIEERLTELKLVENGVDVEKLKSSEAKVEIDFQNFSGKHTSRIFNYVKMFFGGAAGYLLMMFIIIYGNMVMRSVIEEKTNRIVEIIISSVKPIHLMFGKIIGTSLAGITQFIIWVILGALLLMLASSLVEVDLAAMQAPQQQAMEQVSNSEIQQLVLDIASLPLLTLVCCFLFYFIAGYFLYSAIYAAIGAAVDSETDTQQFMFPIILPLMLGIYVGFFSVIENPNGSVSTVFSMIPLTSPIVMLMRIPFGVPWWEIALSIGILILTIVGVVWFAAKIYKIGILMYGKKPSYKDLYKWLKY